MDDEREEQIGKNHEKWFYFILRELLNIILTPCKTKWEQYNIGENLEGYELKGDEESNRTDNLFIEIVERRGRTTGQFVPSGIFRYDNTKCYVQGNYNEIFIFNINTLRDLSKNRKIITIKRGTSKGFILPKKIAKLFADDVMILEKSPKMNEIIKEIIGGNKE